MKFKHEFQIEEESKSRWIFRSEQHTIRLDFFEQMLRVAVLRDDTYLIPTWTVCPEGDCPKEGRDKLSVEGLKVVEPEVTRIPGAEGGEKVLFNLGEVTLEVTLPSCRLRYLSGGKELFADREFVSYNFEGELGRGSTHYVTREQGEKIFGLGDKTGDVNKSGRSFKLGATDAMGFDARSTDPLYKQIPFYICENSVGAYGLYYDTYSNGEADFGRELNQYYEIFKSFRCEEENLVYYVFFGKVPEIVRSFSKLCGPALFPPKWMLQYCGSTMEYTDSPNADEKLHMFADLCAQYGLHPGGFYLSSGYTQIGDKRCVFHWNTDKIPSPEKLADDFRARGMEFLPNIKPAFLTTHPFYEEIASKGYFLHYADGTPAVFPFWGGYGSYLDFTNPDAYAFWSACVKKHLVDRGYRNMWNDNNEYDVHDEDVLACGFGHPIPACRIRPLFSLLMTMSSLEAQKTYADPHGERSAAVSRCGIAGLQRIASTWTGDNNTSFDDFRCNHKMAMTLSLTGMYNFGQDIGGFAGPVPEPELFLRWIQYGLFTPRFVLHSWNSVGDSNMPWLYPELIPTVQKLFALRDALIPYLYNELYRSVTTHDPLIYPVFLKHPGYDVESDAFYCGDDILACPVFDKGADSVRVELPEIEGGWYRGTVPGETGEAARKEAVFMEAGEVARVFTGSVEVDCAAEGLPVWFVRAGSILPWDGGADKANLLIYTNPSLTGAVYEKTILLDDGIHQLTPDNHRLVRVRVEEQKDSIQVGMTVLEGRPLEGGEAVLFNLQVIDPLGRPVKTGQ